MDGALPLLTLALKGGLWDPYLGQNDGALSTSSVPG